MNADLQDARKIYSEKVIENFMQPQNVGKIEDADAIGTIKGICGDTMQICFKVANGKITEIRFITDGCGPTIACGSMATQLAKGKSIQEAMKISPNDILEGLDGLPEDHLHCAILAVMTLYGAISRYLLSK
ncbi:MAG: iron-sulfur cluster assembly scaffold protein [bacterium]